MSASSSLATFLRLAGRNVLRNRSRSALTLGAIFFGVALTVMLAAFGNGLGTLMVGDVLNAKVGGIQIHRHGYAAQKDNQPLKLDLADDGALEARVRAVAGVSATAPRLVFGGLINNGSVATMFVGRGLDPAREYVALPWAARDVAGQPIRAAAPTAGVVGAELGQALGAGAGATLILQATTRDGQQNALDLDVAGLLDNSNAFESKRFVQVPLRYAQDLLRMRGRFTELVVRVEDPARIEAVAAELRRTLGAAFEVETWRDLVPTLSDVITFQRVVMGIISTVFLVIVVFGVINTMVMSVAERTREIGTMMALGVTARRIGLLFVLEAALLAVTGAVSGAAVARAVVALLARLGGFAVAAPGQAVARYHLIPVIPPSIIGLATAASIVGALLAALYPAWKATRLRPVEALRAV